MVTLSRLQKEQDDDDKDKEPSAGSKIPRSKRKTSGNDTRVQTSAPKEKTSRLWQTIMGATEESNDEEHLSILMVQKPAKLPIPFVIGQDFTLKKVNEELRKVCWWEIVRRRPTAATKNHMILSNDVLIIQFDESDTHVLERFKTSAGNPVKEILLKLNLPDHRSILTDSKVNPTKHRRITKPYSSLRFIANRFNAGYLKMEVKVPDSS
ncbi:hypothetical protein Tco_1034133 [Tanacetum coccineum]